MIKLLKSVVLGAAFCASSVFAATVLGPQNASTGIANLSFTDGLYNYSADAAFVAGSYSSAYKLDPTFLNNQAGALSAVNAISDALNAVHVTGIKGVSSDSYLPNAILNVPYSLYQAWGGVNEASYGSVLTNKWELGITGAVIAYSPPTYWGWVVFSNVSVSAVPIPATAWLFGSGLLGLAGAARRKSKSA